MQNKQHLTDNTGKTLQQLTYKSLLNFCQDQVKTFTYTISQQIHLCKCAISKQIFHFQIKAFSCTQRFPFSTLSS